MIIKWLLKYSHKTLLVIIGLFKFSGTKGKSHPYAILGFLFLSLLLILTAKIKREYQLSVGFLLIVLTLIGVSIIMFAKSFFARKKERRDKFEDKLITELKQFSSPEFKEYIKNVERYMVGEYGAKYLKLTLRT